MVLSPEGGDLAALRGGLQAMWNGFDAASFRQGQIGASMRPGSMLMTINVRGILRE